jgi:hypothetical protein
LFYQQILSKLQTIVGKCNNLVVKSFGEGFIFEEKKQLDMKHLILLLLLCPLFLFSQEIVSLKLGVNLANYSDKLDYLRPGLNIGIIVEQPVSDNATLDYELEYKQKGIRYIDDAKNEFKQSAHYLQHNVGYKLKVNRIYFAFGGFFGFRLGNSTDLKIGGKKPAVDFPKLNPKLSNDVGLWAGVGWISKTEMISLQLQYDKGLTNIYPNDELDIVEKTQVISLNLFIKITRK